MPLLRTWRFPVAILWVVMAVFVGLRLRVSTSMTQYLPDGRESRLLGIGSQLIDSTLTRVMVLTVGPPQGTTVAPDAVRDVADRLARDLAADPAVERVRFRVDEELQKAYHEVYFPRRYLFASRDPAALARQLKDPKALRGRAENLRSMLASPLGPLVRRVAPEDPLLLFVDRVDALQGQRHGKLRVMDGRLMSHDGHAVIFVRLADSPLDSRVQEPFLKRLDDAFGRARRAADVTLEASGVNRFAVHSKHAVEGDIRRVSILSTAAVLLLFITVFRSLRPLALAFVPIAAGVIAATAVTLVVHGRVHGLTLAFGSALVGVAVDYPIHLLNHHGTASRGTAYEAARATGPGLALACGTTVVGLLGLFRAALPGLAEIALFTGAGVVGALVATLAFLPPLMATEGRASTVQRRGGVLAQGAFDGLRRARWVALVPVVAAAVVTGVGLPRLRGEGLKALQPAADALQAEEERVRARVGSPSARRFVVATGATLEEALQRNDAAAGALVDAASAGDIEGYESLHTFLWSRRLQEANRRAFAHDATLPARLRAAYDAAGFSPAAFPALQRPPWGDGKPLTLKDLRGTPLGPLARAFIAEHDTGVAVVSLLREVRRPKAFAARFTAIEGVDYLDQKAVLNTLYESYRQRTGWLVALGFSGVFLVLLGRYRRLRPTLAAALPAFLAAGTALGALGLLGISTNVIHVLAVLLVSSMGVDYGVFLVERWGRREPLGDVLFSVLLAYLSTVLSFGVLGLSSVPALRAIGITVAIGVTAALVLAPAGSALLAPADGGPLADEASDDEASSAEASDDEASSAEASDDEASDDEASR